MAVVAALLTVPSVSHAEEGDTLRSVRLPFLWPQAWLRDVVADDAGGAWVTGAQGTYCVPFVNQCVLQSWGNPVVRRWTGTSWRGYPIQGWTGQGEIDKISSGGGETWIGGGKSFESSHSEFLARFDGSRFQKVDKPSNRRIDMISTGPAGTWVDQEEDGNDQAPRLQKRTGSTWTGVTLPGGMMFARDLQARTATDAWAVGGRPDGSDILPAIAHYDGTSWTSVPPPPIPAERYNPFLKVAPVGADDVWAITRKHLAHWDGAEWTVVPLPESLEQAFALAVDGSGTVWVAPGVSSPSVPHRYSGGTWHAIAMPAGTKMVDIAVVPGATTLWGVARKGTDPVFLTNS